MFRAEALGVDKFSATINSICEELRTSATREAVDAACKVIEDVYRSLLPEGIQPKAKPRIRQVVAHKIWKFPDAGGFAGIIGTKSGAAPHMHLIEDGTKERKRTLYGIGGKFKFMMMPRYWNPAPRRSGAKFVGKLIKKPGTKPFMLKPGDPETRTGAMPALHPLYIASQVAIPMAQAAFEAKLTEALNRKIFS